MEKTQDNKPIQPRKQRNTQAFFIIWAGQFFSMTGSFMSSFALGIWAWEQTGSAQALALVGVFTYAPLLIMTPLVGVLVDRWNRKLVMMLSDLGAALASLLIFLLFRADALEIWHIYAATAFASAFQAFQWPAYSASVTLMVPKEHYSRASGFISMVESSSNILGPILAGALIGGLGIGGILLADLLTFLLAIGSLLLVTIPQPERAPEDLTPNRFWQDLTLGFRYIFMRDGLLGLQLVFFGANFMTVIGWAVVSPMVLARTGGDAALLGLVQSLAAVGGLVGSLVLAAWGGPRRLIYGVLLGWLLNGLLGRFLMGITESHILWMVSAFLLAFFMPMVNGCNQAIWQRKVAPELQGRVFSVRRFIAQLTIPISMALSGWLADAVFEPAFQHPEAWGSRLFGFLVGTGKGAGLSLLIVLSGALVALVAVLGWLFPKIRQVESHLPDYDHESQDPSCR
jgi:MFS transporter, DHA3 family, macrolide efflux protein